MRIDLLVGFLVCAVFAYLAQTLLTGTLGTVAAVLLGVGALICVIFFLVSLLRGGGPKTRI